VSVSGPKVIVHAHHVLQLGPNPGPIPCIIESNPKELSMTCSVVTYRFRKHPAKGCRYSLWVGAFVTGSGVTSVLEWFPTMQEAIEAAEEMKADGRFLRISSHVRSQETADA